MIMRCAIILCVLLPLTHGYREPWKGFTMKRILILGANSYIGTALKAYLKDGPYDVTAMSVRDNQWHSTSFAGFDTVVHVAAIVHQHETPEMEHLYFQVNRDLAVQAAKKAKADHVTQFIFLSTMSVYGLDTGIITPDTQPCPVSFYGKSKLAAEELILQEASESFHVCILRSPMVYGPGCKGNFQTIVKLAKLSPVFPRIENQRSMLYIGNLCEFLRLCIDSSNSGIYFPQNQEYMKTEDMVRFIAQTLGKRIFFSRLLGLCVRFLFPFLPMARKAFGTLIYQDMEQHNYHYCRWTSHESVSNSVL